MAGKPPDKLDVSETDPDALKAAADVRGGVEAQIGAEVSPVAPSELTKPPWYLATQPTPPKVPSPLSRPGPPRVRVVRRKVPSPAATPPKVPNPPAAALKDENTPPTPTGLPQWLRSPVAPPSPAALQAASPPTPPAESRWWIEEPPLTAPTSPPISTESLGALPPAVAPQAASLPPTAARQAATPAAHTASVNVLGGSSEISRNTARLSPEHVPRTADSIHIGDLHGNYRICVDTLVNRGIIPASRKIEWMAGNANLVFHGDIIGDRNLGGFQILEMIDELSEQAKKVGGKVTKIAGNHEAIAIDFITGRDVGRLFIDSKLWGQYKGVTEFLRFSEDPSLQGINSIHDLNSAMITNWSVVQKLANSLVEAEEAAQIWRTKSTIHPAGLDDMKSTTFLNDYEKLRKQLLTNMRQDPEGRKILERISSFKLCDYVDDAFHLHTELSSPIIQTLKDYGSTLGESVDTINAIFQQGLRHLLFDEGVLPSGWDHIYKIFTFTDNRDYHKDDGELNWLHDQGVNFVISGHSHTATEDNANIESTPIGVTFVGIDHGAGKTGGGVDSHTILSTGTLLMNGTFVN